MGLAFNFGINFDLETPEQVARALKLVQKNARKFEVVVNAGYKHDKTWFYYVSQGQEAEQIYAWVQTGEGVEPSDYLPPAW
jgi:hypothetical protein